MPSAACRALIAVLCLPLAIFFAFVGWNKAFASLEDLARFGSWTVHLPQIAGRLVGWSEMLCAVGLVAGLLRPSRRWVRVAALVLVGNQLIAALTHARHGENAALPQNVLLIMALLGLALLIRKEEERISCAQP